MDHETFGSLWVRHIGSKSSIGLGDAFSVVWNNDRQVSQTLCNVAILVENVAPLVGAGHFVRSPLDMGKFVRQTSWAIIDHIARVESQWRTY